MASPPKRPRVAVIGAGASGLASLKECLAENLDVVCFEQDSHVGGLWRYVPSASGATGEDTHSSVYMSTIINTSKEMMAYSDFPVPKDWPTFLPHRNVVEYLRLYADNFDLKQHIKFNRKVVSLTPEIGLGGGQTGRWEVVTQKVRRKQPQQQQPAAGSGTATTTTTGLPPSPPLPPRSPLSDVPPVHVDGRQPAPSEPISAATRGRARALHGDYYDPAAGYEPDLRSASASPRDIGGLPTPAPSSPSGSDHGSTPRRAGGAPPFGRRGSRSQSQHRARVKVETFDYVIVATGHHWKPRLPEFNGVEDFKGGLIHSHSYKVPYPFKDQRVLVIGIGNSGADIATELSHHAKVILSSRSGTWILPRFSLFGIPLDHFSSRLAHALPKGVTNFMLETAMRIQHGDLSKFGLNPPTHRVLEAHPTINGHVLDRIASGNVLVRPNVAKFTETAVEFEDGTIEPVDHVIYCTGYRIEHPFLDNALAILGQERADSNRVRLYKHIWPVRHKGIAFVGLVQPIGAVMPVAEMQARWVARVFSGTTTLPTADEMRDRVDVDWTDHQKRYVPKERHTIEVEFVTYMDDLATEVGCKPDLWRLVKASELTLASHLLFGPTVPAQFRLEGPGAWDGARGVIADACAGVIASQPAKKT
ncbi:hypothetical protein HDU90_005898 [Geranomyces variabilis]|nr:hypothetical protein HDU90_005898 [Geranomyces variabilis]